MITLRRRAFTLIELLTVMAISAILLGLIILPLFQSFNLVRTAEAFSEAQSRARIVTERISREIGSASIVSGGIGTVLTRLNNPAMTVDANGFTRVPASSVVVQVPSGINGKWPGNPASPVDVVIPYSKIDLVPPAEGDPTRVNGALVNPITGKGDPTLQAPMGQVNLPAGPGMKLVRYWIGLRDPFLRYQNPYDGLLMARGGGRDNLFVLYRAEIVPYVRRNHKNSPNDDSTGAWRPNLEYFTTDDETDSKIVDPDITDPLNGGRPLVVGLDDPRFFLPNFAGNTGTRTDVRGQTVASWLKRAVILTDVSRYDMVLPVFDKASRAIAPVGTAVAEQNVPRLVPLIQFRPTRVNSDPAEPMLASRPGQETDTAQSVGSDVYKTKYAMWANAVIRVYPQGWDRGLATADDYAVAHRAPQAPNKPMSLYAFNPGTARGGPDFQNPLSSELFDIALYSRLLEERQQFPFSPIYPFSQAVAAANANSNFLNSANLRRLFTPFSFDRDKGIITTSFGLDEVGNPNVTNPEDRNLPSIRVDDPTTTDLSGAFFNPKFNSINWKFRKIYNDYPSLRAGNVHRFIDSRILLNGDGTNSPLYPDLLAGQPTGFTFNTPDGGKRSKVSIVPGSVGLIGPDQLPGPNQGRPVRYTLIARGEPGPNQYKINLTDIQEPTNSTGAIDYSVAYPDLPAAAYAGFRPRVYNPANLISAVLQPRYKVGYIQLYSGADLPIPGDNTATEPADDATFRLYYRFQFTGTRVNNALTTGSATDAIAVDYDTRQLMDVMLTIRNYPQSSTPNPQTVTLKSTAAVRNYSR